MLGFDIVNAGAIQTGIFEADDVLAKSFFGVGGPVGTVRLTANGSDPQIYNLPLTEGTSGQFLAVSGGNQLAFVNGTPGAAVDSMNGLIGALSITSTDDSITVVAAGSTIDLSVAPSVNVVDSFNSATGNVNLVSSGSITFTGTNPFFADVTYPNLSATTNGSYMAWQDGAYISVPAPVTSLNGLSQVLSLISSNDTVDIVPGDGTVELAEHLVEERYACEAALALAEECGALGVLANHKAAPVERGAVLLQPLCDLALPRRRQEVGVYACWLGGGGPEA
jgi:hypothetical protein